MCDVCGLAVERDPTAADEFDAFDVESVGREGWIGWLVGIGGEDAGEGFAGERLPCEGEMEMGVLGFFWEMLVDIVVLERDLEVDEGGLDGDEAALTPADGGELLDDEFSA